MIMESEARKIHGQALQARESGDPLSALKLADQAMVEYQKSGDKLGFAEIHADRALSMRHLWQSSDDASWLICSLHESEAAVDLAQESGDQTALAIPYFNLAKIQEDLADFETAIDSYQEAVKLITENPPASHDRDGVRADFRIHLAVCELKNGDQSAEERVLAGIKELEESNEREVSKFNFDVWMSGAYLSLAEVLNTAEPDKARRYLANAKEIIETNPKLVVRKDQLEKLEKIIDR